MILRRRFVGIASFALAVLSLTTNAFTSHVERERSIRHNQTYEDLYGSKASDGILFHDPEAEYELQFKTESEPHVIESPSGQTRTWNFVFTVEHRRGIQIRANHLKVGDLLIDDLRTSKGVILKPRGELVDEALATYLHAKAFRVMYDQGGTAIRLGSFQAGDVLDVSKRYFPRNMPEYIKSGFVTDEDKVVIDNETTLEDRHIAMLHQEPLADASIRWPVHLNLEFYLRVNWPDVVQHNPERYWVKRPNVEQPLNLLPYEVLEGDIPMGDIVLPDGTIICKVDQPIKKTGKTNSIEIIDSHNNAFMRHKDLELPIISVDPITHEPDTYPAEPGELVFSKFNRNTLNYPKLIQYPEDLEDLKELFSVVKTVYSKARSYKQIDGDLGFPFPVYLTAYPIPFTHDCSFCDELLPIEKDVMKGEHKCKSCLRKTKFPKFVHAPISHHPYVDDAWRKKPMTCTYCDTKFHLWQAHDRTDLDNYDPQIPRQSPDVVQPDRYRVLRNKPGTKLLKDVFWHEDGKIRTLPAGTELTPAIRKMLAERATSPLKTKEGDEDNGPKVEMAQCPTCFGWLHKPLGPRALVGKIGVDEIRRGIVSFPYLNRRVTKLELIVFGLNSKREHTTNRQMARRVTFRRIGDEYFQEFVNWKITKEDWVYLPRYSSDPGDFIPEPVVDYSEATEGGGDDDGGLDGDIF